MVAQSPFPRDVEVFEHTGKFIFRDLKLYGASHLDYPKLMGKVTNHTRRRWSDPVFLATVTGISQNADKTAVEQEVTFTVDGICSPGQTMDFWLISNKHFLPFEVLGWQITFLDGEQLPTDEDIAAEEHKKVVAEKRAAAAGAARAAALARKLKLDSGASAVPVAADPKCLDQTIAALEAEGLESRKRVAELMKYGCIFTVPKMTPVDVLKSEGRHSFVGVAAGVSVGKRGWVATEWLKGSVHSAPPAKPEKKTVI